MMLAYSRIASLLEEVVHCARDGKIELPAEFLKSLELNLISPAIRLLSGTLWPFWERREMNVGPGLLGDVLREISSDQVSIEKQRTIEIGAIAEAALIDKIQRLISLEQLDAMWVYESLYRISNQTGKESEHRKSSIIRGLFLEASPIEGKYIARTIMRNSSSGVRSDILLQAMAKAFNYEYKDLKNAYALLPELGLLAEAACRREIHSIKFLPPRPIKPMIITRGDPIITGVYSPKYPGIRIQLHWIEKKMSVYTLRLKDITRSMNSLSNDISDIEQDFVIDGEIITIQNGRVLGRNDVVKYINSRHHNKRSTIYSAVIAQDLLFLEGQDLTNLSYKERRKQLILLLGDPRDMSSRGLNPAREIILEDEEELRKTKSDWNKSGFPGLIVKNPNSPYLPGERSTHDFLIRVP
ncbi:MAG: hypothetical protein MUO26_07160 [Methanotrichaceae archaeon]|nr:hypothetical protein [Methanotrichaceae archaeon]